MKKLAYLICLLAFVSANAGAQLPQNFSYGPYVTGVQDQLRQGPCDSFAAVGGVEAFYNLSYSGPAATNLINLSEREVYVCGGIPGAPARGLSSALAYIRDQGVIPASCYSMPAVQCDAAVADQGPNMVVYETGRDCPVEQKSCGQHFRIRAPSTEITTQMTTTDGIKQALRDYGPIMLHFYSTAVHGTDHAYLLYGWETNNGETTWLLRDSWPCGAGITRSNVNLAAVFSDGNSLNHAYVLTSVTRENWNGSDWVAQSMTVKPFELAQGMQSLSIAAPQNSCLNRGQYAVASLPAGFSVTGWSVRASYAYYSDAKITSNGVLSGSGADVTVVATVHRPNGMLENITLPVGNVGIPNRVDKTNDFCVTSTQREFVLRLETGTIPGYHYNYSIDIPPSPDNSYYTLPYGANSVYVVSKKVQAINYSTTVEAVKDNNAACSESSTVNQHVISMPCSYSYY